MIRPIYSFRRALSVSIPMVRTPNSRLMFPFVPELEGVPVYGMATFNNNQIAQSGKGETVISTTNSRSLYVTLKDDRAYSFVDNVPYNYFSGLQWSVPDRGFAGGVVIDLQSSYLSATASVQEPSAAVVVFFY